MSKEEQFGFPEEAGIVVKKSSADEMMALVSSAAGLAHNFETLKELEKLGGKAAKSAFLSNGDLGVTPPTQLYQQMISHMMEGMVACSRANPDTVTFQLELNSARQAEQATRLATEAISKAAHEETIDTVS